MNTKVCIKADGDPKRGRLIIAYLESLGGNNDFFTNDSEEFWAKAKDHYFHISNLIIYARVDKPTGYDLIDLPPVIGYKAPCDLWGGGVKKGEVFQAANGYSGNYRIRDLASPLFMLPAEIVEEWEPVFEQSKFSNEKPVGVRVDSFRALAEWVINHRNSVFREADISDEHKKAICHELNISTNIYKS